MIRKIAALPVASLALLLNLTCMPQSMAQTQQVEDLPRYQQVSANLFRGGQPSDEGMKRLKENGIKTIVSLRCKPTQLAHESRLAKELGITFISIPMGGIHGPNNQKVQKFLGIVKDPAAQPVFVHCEEGVDRTGTMVALYREDVEKWPAAKAYQEMVKRGFHPAYVWLTDSVFDYAHSKGIVASGRPLGVKAIDSMETLVSFIKL
jgi:protein tyrosine phosphatase (PTP) superfamily phosphohydrolase (DUF442 family)